MSSLKRPELKNCGILWGDGNIRTAWTQFADDATVINGTLNETQFMLNLFQRWTNWADLIIRPDKCCVYAATKRNGLYQQITQSLSVDGKAIPAVQIGESFTYLGHNFAFATELVSAKAGLLATMHEIIKLVDELQITPLLKMHALNLQLKAKLSFALGQYAIGSTWISQHLDTLVSEKVRSWLSLPPCASAHHLPLPASKLGHELVLPSLLYEQSQAGTRLTLAQSKDPNIRTLFEIDRNPRIDSLLQLDQPRSATQKYIKKKQHEAQIIKQNLLTDQNLTILQLKASLSGKELKSWSEHIEQLTPSIANFARRGLIRCLPTQANLQNGIKQLGMRAQTAATEKLIDMF
jgi:hypothetical protein